MRKLQPICPICKISKKAKGDGYCKPCKAKRSWLYHHPEKTEKDYQAMVDAREQLKIVTDNKLYPAWNNARQAAKQRGYEWSLTPIQFVEMALGECYLCGATKSNKGRSDQAYRRGALRLGRYNGIDRVDNNKGYTSENSRSCCGRCNVMKQSDSVDEFLAHCKKIIKYQS